MKKHKTQHVKGLMEYQVCWLQLSFGKAEGSTWRNSPSTSTVGFLFYVILLNKQTKKYPCIMNQGINTVLLSQDFLRKQPSKPLSNYVSHIPYGLAQAAGSLMLE